MYYQLIIFIGECKNQEMPLCIKYLNRKGIEVRDGTSHLCFSLVDFKPVEIDSSIVFVLVEELIFERSSCQYFFLWVIKMFIF